MAKTIARGTAASLEGQHPGLIALEPLRELTTATSGELAVDARARCPSIVFTVIKSFCAISRFGAPVDS
jgi:hypothetical protein